MLDKVFPDGGQQCSIAPQPDIVGAGARLRLCVDHRRGERDNDKASVGFSSRCGARCAEEISAASNRWQTAPRRSKELPTVGREDMPAIERSPLTGVTTSGILQPLAAIARRPPRLRVAPTALLRARSASAQNTLTTVSSMSRSRLSLSWYRPISYLRSREPTAPPVGQLRCIAYYITQGFGTSLAADSGRASELRLANLPPFSPRPYMANHNPLARWRS